LARERLQKAMPKNKKKRLEGVRKERGRENYSRVAHVLTGPHKRSGRWKVEKGEGDCSTKTTSRSKKRQKGSQIAAKIAASWGKRKK